MSRKPRGMAVSRQDALHMKVQGESVALMQLGELKRRLDQGMEALAQEQRFLTDLCGSYGASAFAERLTDAELERVLNLVLIVAGRASILTIKHEGEP